MRVASTILLVAIAGCQTEAAEVWPSKVSQGGGVALHIDVGARRINGGVVVLVDGIAAHGAVVEAPGRIRVELPSLPHVGSVDVELHYADGTTVTLDDVLEVTAAPFEVH